MLESVLIRIYLKTLKRDEHNARALKEIESYISRLEYENRRLSLSLHKLQVDKKKQK